MVRWKSRVLVAILGLCAAGLAPTTEGVPSSPSASQRRPPVDRELAEKPSSKAQQDLCSVDCGRKRQRPICGTDHVTYRNKCELLQNQECSDGRRPKRLVSVAYKGSCINEEIHRCLEERERAIKTSNESGIPIFVPVCRDDGSYVEVQCHYGTGSCWCVDEDGKAIPGSAIQFDRPNCRKKNPRRRNRRGKQRSRGRQRQKASSSRDKSSRSNKDRQRTQRKKSSSSPCSQSDRDAFSLQAIDLMAGEFRQKNEAGGQQNSRFHGRGQRQPDGSGHVTSLPKHKKDIVTWKFRQLDRNGDGVLRKKEFKAFRLTLKNVSQHRACARHLWKYCDLNSNKRLSQTEWYTCLGLEENISSQVFYSLVSEEDSGPQRGGLSGSQRRRKKQKGPTGREDPYSESIPGTAGSPSEEESSEEEPQACWEFGQGESSRKSSYVPVCQPDGIKYKPVQCFQLSGYCWCVDELTGHPIQETSVRNAEPDCHSNSSQPGSRKSDMSPTEWRKCPENRRKDFQLRLMELMKRQMVEAAKNSEDSLSYLFEAENANISLEERVVKWKFTDLDVNGDQILSRKELHPFRRNLLSEADLRLCGKRIHMNCDTDRSRNLTEKEWDICTGIRSAPKKPLVIPKRDPNRRKGPNPLQVYLKGD